MLELTRAEKDKLQAVFPDEQYIRTRKAKGRRSGKYYVKEDYAIQNALRRIRSGKPLRRKGDSA